MWGISVLSPWVARFLLNPEQNLFDSGSSPLHTVRSVLSERDAWQKQKRSHNQYMWHNCYYCKSGGIHDAYERRHFWLTFLPFYMTVINIHLERNSNKSFPHFSTRSGQPSSSVLWRKSAANSAKYTLRLSFITVVGTQRKHKSEWTRRLH